MFEYGAIRAAVEAYKYAYLQVDQNCISLMDMHTTLLLGKQNERAEGNRAISFCTYWQNKINSILYNTTKIASEEIGGGGGE